MTHYASTDATPSNAQEKYDILRELMQCWRDIGARATEFYRVLEREYPNVFELASFRFDDPDQQLIEDLGLEEWKDSSSHAVLTQSSCFRCRRRKSG